MKFNVRIKNFGYRTMLTQRVEIRKKRECSTCGETIPAGEEVFWENMLGKVGLFFCDHECWRTYTKKKVDE